MYCSRAESWDKLSDSLVDRYRGVNSVLSIGVRTERCGLREISPKNKGPLIEECRKIDFPICMAKNSILALLCASPAVLAQQLEHFRRLPVMTGPVERSLAAVVFCIDIRSMPQK